MVQLVQEAMVYHVSKVQKGGPENAKILLDSQIRSPEVEIRLVSNYLWPTSCQL